MRTWWGVLVVAAAVAAQDAADVLRAPERHAPAEVADALARVREDGLPRDLVERVVALVEADDAAVRAAACATVAAFPRQTAAMLVDRAAEPVYDDDRRERLAAAVVASGDAVAKRALAKALDSGFLSRSSALWDAVPRLGARALPALRAALEDELGFSSGIAASLAVEMGEAARPLLPALREALARRIPWGDDIARAIAALTPDRAEAVRVLVEALERLEHPPQDPLLDAVAALGADGRAAAPHLARWFAKAPEPAPIVRTHWAVARDANAVLPALVAAFRPARVDASPWESNRRAGGALRVLSEMGAAARPASGRLLELAVVRGEFPGLEETLDKTGVDAALVPRLRRWLASGIARTQHVALAGVARLKPDAAAAALPAAYPLLHAADPELRRSALATVDLLGGGDGAIVAHYVRALDHARADADYATEVVQRLGRLQAAAAPAVPALRATYRDARQAGLRVTVLWALGAVGPAGAAGLPEIGDALGRTRREIRFAAQSLLRFGGPGRELAPQLEAALGELDIAGVRAAHALATVAPERAPAAAAYLDRALDVAALRVPALRAFPATGTAGAPHEARLRRHVAGDPVASLLAAYAVHAVAGGTPLFLEHARRAIAGDDAKVRAEAYRLVQETGDAARPLVPDLRRALADESRGPNERGLLQKIIEELGD